MKRITLKKEKASPVGWADHGEVLLIPDVSKDERFSKKADKTSGFVTKSILAVPLKTEGRLIGWPRRSIKRAAVNSTTRIRRCCRRWRRYGAMAIQKSPSCMRRQRTFMATLRALADAIEAKDATTRGRSERIRKLALGLAEEMKLSDKDVKDLEMASLLHDVGKLAIPTASSTSTTT